MAAVKAPIWLAQWLLAFAFTQLIEVPIYLRVTTIRVALAASTITHPVVWFLFPMYWPRGYWSMVAAAEVFAWGLEALWLRSMGVKRPMVWSFVANVASFGLGMLSRKYLGVP